MADIFDDLVDNTLGHLVDKATDPDTYTGSDKADEDADDDE